jgi:hypothetical protein
MKYPKTHQSSSITAPKNMMRLSAPAVLATLVSLFFMPIYAALANDGIIERSAVGGIEFTKSDDIRMLEEVLEISTKEVRVKFRFLNESDHDIQATVAFDAPSYERGRKSPILQSFKVLVNGRPVSAEFVTKAMAGGRDITGELRAIGLSDEQIFGDSALTEDLFAALRKRDGGKGEFVRYGAFVGWKLETNAFWQQQFPAGKEITVEHTYEPSVGRVPSCILYDKGGVGFTEPVKIPTADAENENEACLDEISRKGIAKQIKALAASFGSEKGLCSLYVNLRHIEYILSTGRNWKGPIGKFKLRLTKDSPHQIVSLCFPGKPEKPAPTIYEFTCKDFVPPDRLIVYFYTADLVADIDGDGEVP